MDAYVYLDVECSQSDVVRLAAAKVNVAEVEGVQVALRRFCSRLCAAKVSKVTTEITTLKDTTGNVNAALCGAIAGRCQGSLNRVLTKAGFPIAYADQNAAVESAESDDNSSNINVPIIAGKGIAGYSAGGRKCVKSSQYGLYFTYPSVRASLSLQPSLQNCFCSPPFSLQVSLWASFF